MFKKKYKIILSIFLVILLTHTLSSCLFHPVLSNDKEIISYLFLASNNEALSADVTGTIDSNNHTIDLAVPSGTNVTALVATFTLSPGATAKVVNTSQISGITPNDFTSPIVYTITAENGSTQNWTVRVTVEQPPPNIIILSSVKEITSYAFLASNNEALSADVTGTIDSNNHTIDPTVPSGTNVTALVATFTLSPGATAKVVNTSQISGITPNDFTSPIVYTITAEEGSTQNWTVTVNIAPNTDSTLSDLTVDGITIYGFSSSTLNYNKELPYWTTVVPIVGATPTDFNATVVITQATSLTGTEEQRTATVLVTAEDSTTQKTYTVTFSMALNDAKEIISYAFLASNNEALSADVTGTIDSNNHTIDLAVPSGTNVTALVATFTLSPGATAKVVNTSQTSGTTSNNFGSPFTYIVTAQDGTTQDWTVWVIYGLVYNITQKTNHSTIQEALDSGQSDDIIEARGNEFSESITFPTGKAIVLRNASGATPTIIGLVDTTTVTFPEGCSEGMTLEGFTITHNSGDLGRGIEVNDTTGTLTLNECTISDNSASKDGGGISVEKYGTLTLNECTISDNSASKDGGGISVENFGTLTLNECTISDNSASKDGGGIRNSGTLTLNECTISDNSAGIKGEGGGIDHVYKEGELLTIKGCSITNNSSIQAYSAGIYLRGLDSGGAITIGGSEEADKNTICSNYVTGNPPTLDDQIGNGSASLYDLYEDINNISDVCSP